MQPFAQSSPPPVPVVSRAIGWSYDVDPWTGRAFSTNPGGTFDRGAILRASAPASHLPYNLYGYPSVGREPGAWINPEMA